MADQAKNAQNQAKSAAGAKDPKQQTYSEWASQKYNQQYESWMPWIEDKYLSWFTKDNKTSYATKRKPPFSHYPPHRRPSRHSSPVRLTS